MFGGDASKQYRCHGQKSHKLQMSLLRYRIEFPELTQYHVRFRLLRRSHHLQPEQMFYTYIYILFVFMCLRSPLLPDSELALGSEVQRELLGIPRE